MDTLSISLPLAFFAGLVSFLSPCVLPVVPSYIAFVSGMTLDDLSGPSPRRARGLVAVHAALFGIGFGIVFLTLGAVATAAGPSIARALPIVNRAGGVLIAVFGLYLLGILRLPAFARERRIHLARRPEGFLGSLIVGVAFGAGWTPCIGPILGSILLLAGLEATMLEGTLLLTAYGLGLGVPFFVAAVAFNWFLVGTARLRNLMVPLQRTAGAVLLLLGILMVSGHFATLGGFLAAQGQLFDLELP